MKTYKNGKEDGGWGSWNEYGQKIEEGSYKNGKEDGNWTFWYENGERKKEGIFKDGKLSFMECWDENGNVCECGFVGCK